MGTFLKNLTNLLILGKLNVAPNKEYEKNISGHNEDNRQNTDGKAF